jgi:hypothetical protein
MGFHECGFVANVGLVDDLVVVDKCHFSSLGHDNTVSDLIVSVTQPFHACNLNLWQLSHSMFDKISSIRQSRERQS